MTTITTGATLGMTRSYNTHCQPQLVAIELSIPFIRQAIDTLDVNNSSSSPLIIADFGAAHGNNSIYAMKAIVDYLRETKKYTRQPLIIHNDLPTNDWNLVFELLSSENSYSGVASGRSFYEQCLPNNCLSIGYSANSIHWLSKKPCNISNHCMFPFASDDELAAFKSQACLDYIHFLEHRSRELRLGGVLVLVITCLNDKGNSGFNNMADLLYKCAQTVSLTSQELIDYTLSCYSRPYEDIVDEKLFARCSLQLVKTERCGVRTKIYDEWKQGKMTLNQFGRAQTEIVRSSTESALKQALEMNKTRSRIDVDQLLDRFWAIFESKVNERLHEHDECFYRAVLVLKRIHDS